MIECKICTFCDYVVDPEEMGWIELKECAPIGIDYDSELLIFHIECLKKWMDL